MSQIEAKNTRQFHQEVLSGFSGWTVSDYDFDLINKDKRIYVLLRNGPITMHQESSRLAYILMQDLLLKDKEAICILAEMDAKKSKDIPWRIQVNGSQVKHDSIRRMSIDRLYELVSSQKAGWH